MKTSRYLCLVGSDESVSRGAKQKCFLALTVSSRNKHRVLYSHFPDKNMRKNRITETDARRKGVGFIAGSERP